MKQQRLIAQIHSEFDSAQERLLQQANEILSKNNVFETDVLKAHRLIKIGFTQTKFVSDAQKKLDVVVTTTEQANIIRYYTEKYPFQKFLTEPELTRICKKYNLVAFPVENFIGDVPEKNILDIENTQPLMESDRAQDLIWCELKRDNSFFLTSGDGGAWPGIWGSEWYKIPKRIDGEHFTHWNDACEYLHAQGFTSKYLVSGVTNYTEDRSGLFICAPPSNFKGENLKISSMIMPEVKDPIVFRYVRGGIQVITKWGLEANDPSLVVPKLN